MKFMEYFKSIAVRWLQAHTLTKRMIIWATFIILVVSLTFAGLYVYQESRLLRAECEEQLVQTINVQQKAIQYWLLEQAENMDVLCSFPSVRALDKQTMLQDFKAYLEKKNDFYGLLYINTFGIVEVDTMSLLGIDVSDREYFKQGMAGKSHISKIIVGRGVNKNFIIFSSPVYDEDNNVRGVIAATVTLNTIESFMESFNKNESGKTYILTEEGQLITNKRTESVSIDEVMSTEGFKQALAEFSSKDIYEDYRGRKVIAAFQMIPEAKWVILGEIDENEVLRPLFSHLQYVSLNFILALLITSVLTWLMARNIRDPILCLFEAAEQVHKGNYSCYIPESRVELAPIELRTLCDAFNLMIGITQEQIALHKEVNHALAEAKSNYQKLVENSLTGVYLIQDQKFIYANCRFAEIVGYDVEKLTGGMGLLDLSVKQEDQILLKEVMAEFDSGNVLKSPYVLQIRRANGLIADIEVHGTTIQYHGHLAYLGNVLDITERRQAENLMKKYKLLFENARDIIFFCRQDNYEIIEVNKAAAYAYGYNETEMIGLNMAELYSPELLSEMEQRMYTLKEDSATFETIHRKKNGTRFPVEISAQGLDIGGEQIFISIIRDISERKEFEHKLTHMSLHDQLTGLYNRTFFEGEMKRLETSQVVPLGVVVCDVDGLKIINDTLGHQAGDELLRSVAKVLTQSFRNNDMVARIGGDEFVVLMPNTPLDVVEDRVAKLKTAVTEHNCNDAVIPIFISCGIAVGNELPVQPEELFREADNHMYLEKNLNRDAVRKTITARLQTMGYRNDEK